MPLAGLLRDGSPEARLRIRRCACICHRQRLALDLQRKATRGSVLWTPRRSGESKGKTRVAARAVRRGLEPRIPLTLKHTSDWDEPPPLPAARENIHNKKPRHCEPVTDVTGVAIRLFSGGRGRSPLQGQSAVFIPGSTADGAATRHGSCTGGVQCSLSACTISRFARCCPRLAPFSLWSPRTVSLFAQDRKEKWVLLYAGRTQQTRGRHVAYPKHIAPRGCGALLLYLSRPWARSISSFRAMSFGDRST